MKGCLFLQRTFAVAANAVAAELKERYGVTEFCGFVQLRRSEQFIKNQKDIEYTSILVDEEIQNKFKNEKIDYDYLNCMEDAYGLPNLWYYTMSDRVLMMRIPPKEYSTDLNPMYSHEELLKCLQIRFKVIIGWLEKEKPDFLFCSLVSGMSGLVFYHVAKKMGIRVINVDWPRIDNRVSLSEDYKTLTFIDELFLKIQNKECEPLCFKEAYEFLKKFRNQPQGYQPHLSEKNSLRLKEIKFLLPKNFLKGAAFWSKCIFNHLIYPPKSDYTDTRPWSVIYSKLRRALRSARSYSSLYGTPDWNANFCYYQMHFEPELAMSVLAPFYPDQIHLINQIARSLPVGFDVYVREHREMLNHRPKSFYKKLTKMPNVKLIPPEVDLFELLEKAKLVAVITSTAGFEAALLGKQVITFGNVFYNRLSSVTRCEKIEDLPRIIKQKLNAEKIKDEELINYLSAVFKESVSFDLLRFWFREGINYQKIKQDPGFKEFVRYLAEKLQIC